MPCLASGLDCETKTSPSNTAASSGTICTVEHCLIALLLLDGDLSREL